MSCVLKSPRYCSATARATSVSAHPSSASGTNKGQVRSITLTVESICRDSVRVRTAFYCRFSGDDSDRFSGCNFYSRSRAWFNHANYRDLYGAANRRQRERRSCVAGDYQKLDAMRFEKSCVFNRVAFDRSQRLRAVRHSRGVAKINKVFVGKTFVQRAIDRQSTNAAVKDSNGKGADFGFRISDCGFQDLAVFDS